MAAPIITGTTPAGPLTFAPGQTIAVRVEAHDPDSGPPVMVGLRVEDSQGNATPLNLSVRVEDPLTYSADSVPTGWQVAQDAADQATFHITAPTA